MEVAQPELGRPIFGKVDEFSGEKNFEMVGEDRGGRGNLGKGSKTPGAETLCQFY